MDSGQVNQRNRNRYATLKALHYDGALRRGQIAAQCGIRRSSVTSIASELLDVGIVVEDRPESSRSPLALDTKRFHAVVANLTPAACTLARVFMDGRIADRQVFELPEEREPQAVLDLVGARFREYVRGREGDVLGGGIAMPGTVDPRRGTCLYAARLPLWRDVAVAQELENRIGFPVLVENDVRCQLWSCIWFERLAPENKNTIYASVHEGVACAILMHGERIIGEHCAAGELGHIRVGEDGRVCHCGRADCLETYCSIPAILAEIQRLRPEAEFSSAADLARGAAEDTVVLNVLDRVTRRLARALSGLMAVIDPNTLVIGTPDRAFSEVLHDLLKRHLYSELIGLRGNDATIVTSESVQESSIKGMAGLIVDQAFETGEFGVPASR